MEDYSDYIVPLFTAENEQSFCGTGFVLNEMLITAGHVPHPGGYIFLKDDNAFILRTIYDQIRIERPGLEVSENAPDIAIYFIPGLESPLELSTELPPKDEILTSICWQKTPYGLKQITSQCLLFENEDSGLQNKSSFHFVTNNKITHGSSGSPLLIGNKVYGMLVIGTERYKLTPEGIEALKQNFSQEEIEQFVAIRQNICTAENALFLQEQVELGKSSFRFRML